MKSNKTRALAFCCMLCAALLCVALLLPLTLGRYGSSIDGYIEFNVGTFNAAILQTENLSGGEGSSTASKFVEYSIYDFKPGMYSKDLDPDLDMDTAATTKFRIQNGNKAADAATVPLEYTIRIRTSNSLPLRYTLKSTEVLTAENGTQTTQVSYYHPLNYYHPNATPDVINEGDENEEPRYEYQFSDGTIDNGQNDDDLTEETTDEPAIIAEEDEIPSEETEATAPDGELGEESSSGEEETTDQDPPPEYVEITFRLDPGQGSDKLVYRDHELIAEWSTEGDDAQSKYMKEVEIVEILVTVISVNKSDDPAYIFPQNPVTGDRANGIVIMDPDKIVGKSYTYELDLRSFKNDPVPANNYEGAFGFTLNNGYSHGLKPDVLEAEYTMTLHVPAELVDGAKTDAEKWIFGIYRNDDGSTVNLMTGAQKTYFLRNMKTGVDSGSYDTYASAQEALKAKTETPTDKQAHYEIYIAYQLALADNTLSYKEKDNTQKYVSVSDKHGYTFRTNHYLDDETAIPEDEENKISGTGIYDKTALLSKLEVVIAATLRPVPASTPDPEPTT